MSERNGGGGPEARGTGSSLTDAVVAALANVSSTPPPGGGSSGSDPEKKAQPEPDNKPQPEPAAKASPTVITGTEPVGAPAPVEPAPTAPAVEVRDQATEPRADATEPTVVPAAASVDLDRVARHESPTLKMPTIAEQEGGSVAATVEAAPAPAMAESSSSSSEGAPSEPTVKLGGAPVESLTQDAAATAEGIAIQYYGRTDVGLVREHNEDNFLVVDLSTERRGNDGAILRTTLGSRGLVLAVCDGMGGAAAGEVASQMAVDTIHEILQAGGPPKDRDQFARRLVHAIEEAGARIFSAAKMDRTRRGMGTTSTVAGLVDSTLFVGQVGDSRAYVLRGDQFSLITKDQSLVNQLIEAGQLTEEEAEAFEHSNIILQALGTTEEVTVDLTFLELRRGDRLLMCSDGLSGLVHADMMREVLKSSRDLSEAAQQLIAMANAGGGHDNITVILAEFDGTTLREATAEARVAYQQYPLPPEDPSESESAGKSATSIKSGGPKPGADVKSGEVSRPRTSSESGGGKLWLVAVIVLLVLVGIAAVIVMMDDGEHAGAADEETTRVTIASEVSARAPAPVASSGRVVVRTDAEGGVLYVNGERYVDPVRGAAPLGAGETTLALAPGAYRLEIRQGDVRIADTSLTVESGREERVALTMPAGAIPEAGGEDVLAQREEAPIDTLGSPVAQQQAAQQRPHASPTAASQGMASQGIAAQQPAGQPTTAQQVQAVPGQVL